MLLHTCVITYFWLRLAHSYGYQSVYSDKHSASIGSVTHLDLSCFLLYALVVMKLAYEAR